MSHCGQYQSLWTSHLGHVFLLVNGKLQEEFGVDALYIGRWCDKPSQLFRVGRDVYASYFVVVRPSDSDSSRNCAGLNRFHAWWKK
jgi:hypothetical protein